MIGAEWGAQTSAEEDVDREQVEAPAEPAACSSAAELQAFDDAWEVDTSTTDSDGPL